MTILMLLNGAFLTLRFMVADSFLKHASSGHFRDCIFFGVIFHVGLLFFRHRDFSNSWLRLV